MSYLFGRWNVSDNIVNCVLYALEQNFLFNSLHLKNAALISRVWEAISTEIQTMVC